MSRGLVLIILFFVFLCIKNLVSLVTQEDEIIIITCYHFHSRKPCDMRLIRCLRSPNDLYTISHFAAFNIFRYNRRSRQNLSSSVQSCHSKAIFHLPFPILSQQVASACLFASLTPHIGDFKATENFSVKFQQMYSLFPRVCYFYACLRLARIFLKVKPTSQTRDCLRLLAVPNNTKVN